MKEKHAFVMMIHKKWWDEFRRQHHQGRKIHSYVRKGAAPPKDTCIILFYVTKPVGEIAGHAEFIERRIGDPDKLWKEHGNESALESKEKYEEFINGAEKVSFIRFRNLHASVRPIPLNSILMSLGVKRLGRRGFYINKETEDRFVEVMKQRIEKQGKNMSASGPKAQQIFSKQSAKS